MMHTRIRGVVTINHVRLLDQSSGLNLAVIVPKQRRRELNLCEELAVLNRVVLERRVLKELDGVLHDMRGEIGV